MPLSKACPVLSEPLNLQEKWLNRRPPPAQIYTWDTQICPLRGGVKVFLRK
jgi:hypothetical protein